MDKKQLGKKGEDLASNLYKKLGHKIIYQNLRTPFGEIDLITEHHNQIYVIEVKTNSCAASPIHSWYKTQRIRLIKSIRYLLATNQLTSPDNITCHFIIFEIQGPNKVRCKRYKNIPLCI